MARPISNPPRFPLQDCCLPVQRHVVQILGRDRLDHDRVARQTLLDNPRRQRRQRYRALLATTAGPLLPLDDPHEVPRRPDVQLLALVVSDHRCFRAALPAGLFRARHDLFDSLQMLRQTLPSRVQLPLAWRRDGQRRALRLCFYFIQRRARFLVGQQFQLQVVQRLALRPQHLDAEPPQLFDQRLDFQMRPRQLSLERCDARLGIGEAHGEV